jgi:hypothetical protein
MILLSNQLLSAFPNIESLEVFKCDYKDATEFEDLLSLKRLKSLKIRFAVRLDEVKLESVIALKKLCQHVENCEIEFVTLLDCSFIEKLAEQLKGEMFDIYFEEKFKCLKIKINY